MATELPIACSLTAAQLPGRLAEMAELGREALLHARVDGDGAQLRFAADAGVHERVQRVVAAERACCGFLGYAVEQQPDGVLVRIQAAHGAEALLREWACAFGEPRLGVS
jgi:hypothetical protein